MNSERDFKGIWISREIWLDKRLNALEKVILMEIDSLDIGDGCYASNQYLAEFCGCSETKVSLTISKLIDMSYIYVSSFNGRTRFLKSRLSKNERQDFTNLKAGSQNLKDINIKENNKRENKNINKENIKEIVEYLNEKTRKHYRVDNQTTTRLINALFNKKYSIENIKQVIDCKCKEWLGNEYEKYLRPETLFGNKFESYLNSSSQEQESLFDKLDKKKSYGKDSDYVDLDGDYNF